jgi:hypothetical protein
MQESVEIICKQEPNAWYVRRQASMLCFQLPVCDEWANDTLTAYN